MAAAAGSRFWSIMDRIMQAKGARSLRVTLVKGHATEENFLADTSTPLHTLGSDNADRLAERGVLEHCDGLLQLTLLYGAQQDVLKRVFICTHSMSLRIMK